MPTYYTYTLSGLRSRLTFLVLLLIVMPCSTVWAQSSAQGGSYYALIIGINDYGHGVPKLRTAVNDALEVAKVLSDQYGFQVKLLTDADATRATILGTLDGYRRTLRDNDSLLIYYAGHGYADQEEDKAYWLPVDAERSTTSQWIIADELTSKMRVNPARHVLVISDSCYSGGLLRDADVRVRPSDTQTYLSKMSTGRSRTLMSSGGDEPVADDGGDGHSVFANAVLEALRDTKVNEFTAGDLFHDFVLRQVAGNADQIPKYSSIRNSGDGSGDFVFTRNVRKGGIDRFGTTLRVTVGKPSQADDLRIGSTTTQTAPTLFVYAYQNHAKSCLGVVRKVSARKWIEESEPSGGCEYKQYYFDEYHIDDQFIVLWDSVRGWAARLPSSGKGAFEVARDPNGPFRLGFSFCSRTTWFINIQVTAISVRERLDEYPSIPGLKKLRASTGAKKSTTLSMKLSRIVSTSYFGIKPAVRPFDFPPLRRE